MSKKSQQQITLDRISMGVKVSTLEARKAFIEKERFYYFINRGFNIFDIAYSYDKINFPNTDRDSEEYEQIIKVITSESDGVIGWIECPLSDVYEERQPFMKSNNRRIENINKIIK